MFEGIEWVITVDKWDPQICRLAFGCKSLGCAMMFVWNKARVRVRGLRDRRGFRGGVFNQ